MSNLEKISGKYFSDEVNIIDKLYSPCLKWATHYVRDAGYFNSNVYHAMSEEILDFILRNRKNHITLITNIDILPSDFEAIRLGNSTPRKFAINELQEMFDDNDLVKPIKMLAAMVKVGQMTVYVSLRQIDPMTPHSQDHSKSGYFSDGKKIVAFDGSINETFPAVVRGLEKGNKELFNIYEKSEVGQLNWNMFAQPIKDRLDNDCKGPFPKKSGEGTIIVRISDLKKEDLPSMSDEDWDPKNHKKRAAERSNLLFKKFENIILPKSSIKFEGESGIKLRPHQQEGVDEWEKNGFVGILEHATGSGKTITALSIIAKHAREGYPVLVLVPSEILLKQWIEEIRKFMPSEDVNPLAVGGGNNRWKKSLGNYLDDRCYSDLLRITVAIINSARTPTFLKQTGKFENALVVVDECHRIGSRSFSKLCDWKPKKTLGLSATPNRYGDPEGTDRMKKLCGEVLHKFSLRDALRAPPPGPYLTPYVYNIETVSLSDEHDYCGRDDCQDCEKDDYNKRMAKITRMLNQHRKKDGTLDFRNLPKNLKLMIIQAKRIIKKARDKSEICAKIISENYEVQMEKEHWLVYCEDGNQLNAVRNEIEKQNIIGKNSLYEYWSRAKGAVIDGKEMKFAGEETLARWKHTGGVMLSIACLDEGVNIEEISHGIILASSKNPRQFIQRRGRMLRLHDDKILARIWDSLVVPDSDMKHGDSTNYVLNEINRAKLFAEDSEGGTARQELTNIRHQLNLHDVFAGGDIDGSEEDDDLMEGD